MIEESSNKYGEIIPLAEVHKNILPIDLPMGYNYRFERFRTIDTVVIKFCAIIRVNIQDELQAMDCGWISFKVFPRFPLNHHAAHVWRLQSTTN